jgi:hypothetical protein
MGWNMKMDFLESCSCAAVCPCTLGPAKPDQGWCSGVFALNVTGGESEGVDLSGVKMVMHFELQGDFLGGIDKAVMYYDTGTSEDQRRELDAIFHGERGGLWGGMREAIKEWLPSKVAGVKNTDGDSPGATVEGLGQVVMQPIKTESGKQATMTNAPILEAFSIGSVDLVSGIGTKFSDPDLRAWESLGAGSMTKVEWSA